jgi:hypothetical protein
MPEDNYVSAFTENATREIPRKDKSGKIKENLVWRTVDVEGQKDLSIY